MKKLLRKYKKITDMGNNARILDFIAASGQNKVPAAEIAKACRVSVWTARSLLDRLRSQGLVDRVQEGKAMLYSARPGNAAIPLFKAFTTVQSLEPLLKKLRSQTDRIVLYGPCSRGTDEAGSDINLFIVAHSPARILNITEPYRLNGRRILTIINTPGAEVTIKTEDPGLLGEIEAGLVLWQDPGRPVPRLVTSGGGRRKIGISTTWFKWKRSADPGRTSEPYIISMAFDAHTFNRNAPIEPFFNAMPFPNVVPGDKIDLLGQGHLYYGPRDPGSFIALSIFWMEKDQGSRNLGQTISDLQGSKKVKKSLAAIVDLAGEGLAKLMPGVQAVSTIVAEALKMNRDDEIYRTDGVYLRAADPPYSAGSEVVLGNVFLDFNVKVMNLEEN